ncbi:MAG: NADH-quinone oxidoreductase subunit N [Verrucomicrobiae bacterium]|nr:NADH-quinone oxidoreductase subunit N [Verrucomicrobiae bacterium]
MNAGLLLLEYAVIGLALLVVALDLFCHDSDRRRQIGLVASGCLAAICAYSFLIHPEGSAFGGAYVMDPLALWFKRFFLLTGVIVMVVSTEYAKQFETGVSEYYVLQLFALTGMLFAASANHFMLLFVALELMTVTFYVLVGYMRQRVSSLEAGVKYLVLAAMSSAFLIYGIALVYGVSGTMDFTQLGNRLQADHDLTGNVVLRLGMLLLFLGLAFKLAAFPVQIWAPDVYEGAPTPTTAFLAAGSKAVGVVLLLRLMGQAAYEFALGSEKLLMIVAGLTILYGSLCALPQRNLKRMLGYSSIASAGYLLMGFAAMSASGSVAILYYMAGYLFSVLGAFAVVAVVANRAGAADVGALAGLSRRNPLMAATLTMAMVSLAGIPPLAGFFGKFLIFKSVLEQGVNYGAYYYLVGVAIFGVIVSLYYYFNVIRAVYWSKDSADLTPIEISSPLRYTLWACIGGMLWLGLYPQVVLKSAAAATALLKLPSLN